MKNLIVTAVAVMVITAYSDEAKELRLKSQSQVAQRQQLSPEEKAARHKKWLERTGGKAVRQGEGKIDVINCQNLIFDDVIKTQQVNLSRLMHVEVEVSRGAWKMGDSLPKGAKLVIYLVNDATLPPSLIAPEARWAVVNCANLVEKRRFNKIFVRTAIGLLVGSSSQIQGNLMRPILELSDVDGIVNEAVPFDSTMIMSKNLRAFGIFPDRIVTYRKACQEGWAATPTNDIQKAIWNEVNSIPTEPIKIKKQK